MKRLFFSLFFLIVGAALGGGGLFLVLNWKDYNPFRDKNAIAAKSLLGKFRATCASDRELRGAYLKSANIQEGKLTLLGFTATKDQITRLQAMGQTILDENAELKAQCEQGVSFEGLQVIPFFEQLPLWQREFEELKGAEKDTKDNVSKREVMRTTRLDSLRFDDDGKLIVKGVCIRGDKKKDATRSVLDELLQARVAASIPAELMPELDLDILYHPNPATVLQNKLVNLPGAKDARVVSAFYDAKGKLHLEAMVAQPEQSKVIREAFDAILQDPRTREIAKSPDGKDGATEYALRPLHFDATARTTALQKKLALHAQKADKPSMRQARLTNIALTPLVDEKKEAITDDEGNPTYVFRVTGRLLDSPGDRKQVESDLADWLAEQLPRVSNANQSAIAPMLDLNARATPIVALQERAVQRGLDGVAFTDAYYDGDGKLEIVGRLHQPGEEAKQTVESAVKDLLAGETPWSLALKPHETSKDGQPVSWADAVRECRAKLASDNALGRRIRLDRLHFSNDNGQLKLVCHGAFLADGRGEKPGSVIAKQVDAVVQTRNKASVVIANLREIANPLTELQNRIAARPDLDGALLTQLRFDAEARLHLDGFLGQDEHRSAVAALLGNRLTAILGLVSDPKGAPGWSMDAMRLHPFEKVNRPWPELVRACQGELAMAPELASQRSHLERLFFQYEEKAGEPRRLTLQCETIQLALPKEKDDLAPTNRLSDAAKRLLPEAGAFAFKHVPRTETTPIFELQKLAQELKFDGMLFADAFYDSDGKLSFDGMRSGDTKAVQRMIEEHLAKKAITPAGFADLSKMKLSPWQAMLDDTRAGFAGDAQPFFRQTRIDRAYFEHDAGKQARIRFEGLCIHQGRTPTPEQFADVLTDRLTFQLQAKGITGYKLAVDGIERKANPVVELQKKAIADGVDGVDFSQIGFDAKGACYIRLPFVPKGQEPNIRKLLDDAARAHRHLVGGIQQR